MLYWVWFFGLTVMGWILAYSSARSYGLNKTGFSFLCLFAATIVSYDDIGGPLMDYLDKTLPSQGEFIHIFTAGFISVFLGAAWVLLPSVLSLVLLDKKEQAEKKNILNINSSKCCGKTLLNTQHSGH